MVALPGSEGSVGVASPAGKQETNNTQRHMSHTRSRSVGSQLRMRICRVARRQDGLRQCLLHHFAVFIFRARRRHTELRQGWTAHDSGLTRSLLARLLACDRSQRRWWTLRDGRCRPGRSNYWYSGRRVRVGSMFHVGGRWCRRLLILKDRTVSLCAVGGFGGGRWRVKLDRECRVCRLAVWIRSWRLSVDHHRRASQLRSIDHRAGVLLQRHAIAHASRGGIDFAQRTAIMLLTVTHDRAAAQTHHE